MLDGYLAAFEAGLAHGIAEPVGEISTEALCRLLGACAAADGARAAER